MVVTSSLQEDSDGLKITEISFVKMFYDMDLERKTHWKENSEENLWNVAAGEDDVAGVDDSWDVSEDGEKNVDCQVVSASLLHPDSDWLKIEIGDSVISCTMNYLTGRRRAQRNFGMSVQVRAMAAEMSSEMI
ncbi:hypothetical protein GCK72_024435 [Caenorhabditis remanei]|uniref:Uncharacterized protein n=1 Tax=Caenorhabditis remanei TaxID=31234 RepID=A0A6A5G079_CAERE|nr:hypothetical protein GCK72_024435 [Caenorhabditis remanei]KAF1747969.1 hypothetical protein GCK72_024435 [Caenorhabditis remanei]